MKKIMLFLIIIALVVPAIAGPTGVETFDDNNAGWKSVQLDPFALIDTNWHANGGNDGGYISISLATTSRNISFQPTDAYGSGGGTSIWPMAVGDTITADFKINGTAYDRSGSSGNAMVRFYVGYNNNYWQTKDMYSWNPNDDVDWTTHQIALIADNFVQITGSVSFENCVANVDDLGLQFGPSSNQDFSMANLGFTGDATLMLDNFGVVVPVPGAVLLGGIGVGLVGWFRRRHSL